MRQGHLESPWERLVGGVILGEAAEAQRILKGLKSNRKGQTPVRKLKRVSRPDWSALVAATEKQLGRRCEAMASEYGDWGRDGLMAVATRHLGWRLVEVVREIPGLSYGAAAQGIRRSWKQLPQDRAKTAFQRSLLKQLSKI